MTPETRINLLRTLLLSARSTDKDNMEFTIPLVTCFQLDALREIIADLENTNVPSSQVQTPPSE